MGKILGLLIKELRSEKAETGTVMARKLGISNSYLSQVERGNYGVSQAWITHFCKIYNLNGTEKNKFTIAARKQTIKHKLEIISRQEAKLLEELERLEQ